MLKRLLLIPAFFLAGFTFAEIQLISFYFEGASMEATAETQIKLDEIKERQRLNEFQVIEMNSFATGSANNSQLSQDRVGFITQLFELDNELININCFGGRREAVNFRPKSWNRIDVYYFLGDLKELPTPEIIEQEIVEVKKTIVEIEKEEKVVEKKEVIIENTPILLPIKFEGGTAKVLANSTSFLDELYDLLNSNPEYNAEINGHVCCENNMRMSKKRAKVVYEFLIQKGIDKERLTYQGFSNSKPIVFPERGPKDRAKNRRVEVVFTK